MITITTSNVNGIRAAKRKGIETWAGEHAPDIWCMQEVRAPQDELDPIFGEFGFEYATAGKIADQSELTAMNEVCRVKGRAGVGLLTDLPVTARRYGLPGLDEDVDSGRWIEADVTTPQGYGITVACVYVHAGNSDDPVKMAQKYRFLDTMLTRMGELRDEASRGGRQAVLCGDFNIAHTPLDIKNAKANDQACRVPARRTRLRRPLAGGVRVRGRRYARSPATSRGRTRGGASAAGRSTTTSAGASTISSPLPELGRDGTRLRHRQGAQLRRPLVRPCAADRHV